MYSIMRQLERIADVSLNCYSYAVFQRTMNMELEDVSDPQTRDGNSQDSSVQTILGQSPEATTVCGPHLFQQIMPDALTGQKSKLSTEMNLDCDAFVEVTLPGAYMLSDIIEIGPGRFELPVGSTIFVGSQNVESNITYHFSSATGEFLKQRHAKAAKAMSQTMSSAMYTRSTFTDIKNYVDSIKPGTVPYYFPNVGATPIGLLGSAKEPFGHNLVESHPFIIKPSDDPLEKQQAQFKAKAILAAAFAKGEQIESYQRSDSILSPFSPFKKFDKSPGVFQSQGLAMPPKKKDYIGTNRTEYIPAPWSDPDDGNKRYLLQFFNAVPPYTKYSLEELRLGDYLRQHNRKAPHFFPLFKKLPPELRVMVWKHAQEQAPRVVEIRYEYMHGPVWSPTHPPTLLSVNHESRKETLKVLGDGVNIFAPSKWMKEQEIATPILYFNFPIDTLFLTYEKNGTGDYEGPWEDIEDMLLRLSDTTCAALTSIAVDNDLWLHWMDDLEDLYDSSTDNEYPELDVLARFENLKYLQIVFNGVSGYWPGSDAQENDHTDANTFITENVTFTRVCEHLDEFGQVMGRDQVLAQLKTKHPDWSLPKVKYLLKVANDSE
jgi:hypothetical protein